MVAELRTSNGVAFLVDDEDAESVRAHRWHARKPSMKLRKIYICRTQRDDQKKVRAIYLHRFLMKPRPDQQVDHKDGDSLDNTRANLRVCTRAQNLANRQRPRSRSGFIGVTAHGRTYRAAMGSGAARRYLGSFEDPIDAARAYDAEAVRVHGEFAQLNFPRAIEQALSGDAEASTPENIQKIIDNLQRRGGP